MLFFRFVACTASLAIAVWFCVAIGANPTTGALVLLLIVLGAATKWGIREAIYTSIAGVLCFNYYFLPPVRTFTIADPENLIAFVAFLATAVTASQLSLLARKRAEEALAGRDEIQKLYDLSRALLMDEEPDAVRQSVIRAGQILQMPGIAFFDAASGRTYGAIDESRVALSDLSEVASQTEVRERNGMRVIPVRLGNEIIGSLAVEIGRLSSTVMDSVASLLAIGYERSKALDRAAAAEVARRNEEFKSSLLDGLAHDLKTPLTAIRTCVTRLIAIPPRTEEVRQELLSIIDEESDRLQRSISEAIELARIESKELRLDRQWRLVRDIVEAAVTDLRDENIARYSTDIPAYLSLHADPDLLRRALMQILENARKYTSPESPIRVEAHDDGGEVTISVLDSGPGFSPDETERVFDKFYRGRRGREKAEGTGMGLAIARGIVEAHGGKMRASNRKSGGAMVSILLPATSGSPPSTVPQAPESA